MILYVIKWNIHPDKADAYSKWTQGAIERTLGAGGVAEFRGYGPASGPHQVVVTFEFADMNAWADWNTRDATQEVLTEVRTLVNDTTMELWGPSQVVPEPIRPGG